MGLWLGAVYCFHFVALAWQYTLPNASMSFITPAWKKIQFTARPLQMFRISPPTTEILLWSDKDNKMHSNFRYPHSHTYSHTCSFHVPLLYLVCITVRFWSALSTTKNRLKKKKIPSTLINQTWASSGLQLAFPCRPPHSPPFALPLTQSVTAPSDSSRWADESYANVPCL